jgi:hypothetical protein
MEYRGIHYTVVEAGAAFKWTVHLPTGARFGEAPNRPLATIQAIKAIDKQERQTRAALKERGDSNKGARDALGTEARRS